MLKQLSFAAANLEKTVVNIWSVMIIAFFALMTIIIFPAKIVKTAPEAIVAEGVNGYVSLAGGSEAEAGEIFKLRGEWEFYPNQLYTFNDFTNGRTGEPQIVEFPHFWGNEPDEVIDNIGYATYRMRVRVPASFDGIGIYSRYQYSAYDVYLNDMQICGAGVVSEDFSEHEAVYLPTNGYTSAAIGSEGRTFSVILHVQNNVSDYGGFGKDVLIGSADSIKTLRTLLLMINGFISGGLLLLFICFFLIYLNGRERTEYLDYTIVSLIGLFISLTNGGESLMYSIGLDSVLLVRLEYCAFITGAFFANYSTLKSLIRSKIVFNIIYIYTAASMMIFLFAPLTFSSKLKIPIMVVSVILFVPPLADSFKNTIVKHDFNSIISLFSYIIVSVGLYFLMIGEIPWDSVDLFSLAMMIHCILQMVMFLNRYRKTELALKDLTETLEERIMDRTIELTFMKEKAEAATAAKSNFLATMSHEIRTPMNAIMGISDLMRTDNLDQVQQNYLSDIKKSSKALLQIINDILDFSKIEAGKLEIIPVHFNLMAAYDNICSICHFSADAKDLEFRHYFAPDVPQYIVGDEIRYRQVIINIINNAIKYTQEGYVDFRVQITMLYGIPFLTFIVKDTGIGIKPEDFTKLFDSFEQLDSRSNRKIQGTGLGLSISKLLVTLMNGDVQVESEPGKGSTFTIYLPLEEGDSEKVSIPVTYIPVIASDAKILVVDDNKINLTVAAGFLAMHGIQPDTALSGAEAIEKITENSYDLVFMDHMMPEMDGVEATRIIRSLDDGRFSGLPIVALTANAVTGAKDIFKEAGMNDFLSKPIEAAQINQILKQWLPADKITDGPLIPVGEDGTEDDPIFNELYRIEGLDVSEGISHVANNKTVYLSILRQFCNEFDKYISDITHNVEVNDWTDYTIKLHAMKGIFANIGVESLSKWAFKLETASRDGEYPVCQNETSGFCEKAEQFRDKLINANLLNVDNVVEKTLISAQDLKKLLEELSKFCMLGDSDSAEEIQNELSKRSFNSDIDKELDEIYSLISSFDFELIADKIQDILTRI